MFDFAPLLPSGSRRNIISNARLDSEAHASPFVFKDFPMRTSLAFAAVLVVASPVLAQKEFGFDNRKPSGQPYLKPEETVARMKVADGFEVKLFAAEPQVVNPIAFTIDEKGRVWVVECFEYPKRTPKGKMPRDRIVILEDTDGDGVCDKRTVFAEGKDFPVPRSGRRPGSARSTWHRHRGRPRRRVRRGRRRTCGSSRTRTTSRASSRCC